MYLEIYKVDYYSRYYYEIDYGKVNFEEENVHIHFVYEIPTENGFHIFFSCFIRYGCVKGTQKMNYIKKGMKLIISELF